MKSSGVVATIFVAVVLCLPLCAVAGFAEKIVGTWEFTAQGITVTAIYVPDGTLFLKMPQGETRKGKWSIKNDILTMEGQEGVRAAKILHLDGTSLVIESEAPDKPVSTWKRVK